MSNHAIGLINRLAQHRVAANLLMLLMFLVGGYALLKINTQFLPSFDIQIVSVTIPWQGATAEDVERSLTTPIELELRDVDSLKEMRSLSREGISRITLEFEQDADMQHALDQVEERVSSVRNLPVDAERPIVSRITRFEPIARVLLSGDTSLDELRRISYDFERELLLRGIAKVRISGLPDQEIAIQVPTPKLVELGKSLDQIADLIRLRSQDIPAGTIGRSDVSRQLRSLSQQRDEKGFLDLPLISDDSGRLLRVGDIATVEKRARDDEVTITLNGKPTVQIELLRSASANALKSAEILHQWLADMKTQLPPNLELRVYDERWQLIKQRINLLVENGILGFVLIISILFLLLNRKVAFWVAMGIPVSLAAAVAVLWAVGGSINMVSMFAFIMTLGIIVDDTIVVGEEALTQITTGKEVLPSVQDAAHKMLPPIAASSLTTISAFLPLMIIGDVIGEVLKQIPLVVICVIFASLLECFFILPGHLHHSLKHVAKEHGMRKKIDAAFNGFKQGRYRNLVVKALAQPWLTLSLAAAGFVLAIGLIIGGRINFTFFPQPDGTILRANVVFNAGTSEATEEAFIQHLQTTLMQAEQALTKGKEKVVITPLVFRNTIASSESEDSDGPGDEYAHLLIELTEPDNRETSNVDFVAKWRSLIKVPPSVENLTITAPRTGPPGRDIDIQFESDNIDALKAAAQVLENKLRTYQGVTDVKDNMPYGQMQYIFELSEVGRSLGLTTNEVGRQLRAAFSGRIVQIFHEPNEEIEVKVMLPDSERDQLLTLESLPIVTARGDVVPLQNVVNLRAKRGVSVIRHTDSKQTVRITAEVNNKIANANNIITELRQTLIPKLVNQYGLTTSYKGRSEEQAATLTDMKLGVAIAATLIYLILAWVFASYTLPILIMLAIPLGLTGAIFGHWLLGIDITILSLFGFFGLSGIVINDSIILVNRYMQIRGTMPANEAITEASVQRLRAVILTSLTTVAGLTPLMFETSIQAQFLIPMAVSIAFGLLFATLLILLVVPCLLLIHQHRPEE